jgi:endonuclease YncB( thermonuclease family)
MRYRAGRRASGRSPQRWPVVLGLLIVLAALQWWQQRGRAVDGPDGHLEGRPRLVDGDSFHMGGNEVRLVGIDAPEGRQTCTRGHATWRCGEESRAYLARLVAGQAVSCRSTERDQHGRYLAVCTGGGRELNREMVASGMALAYGNYEKEEAAARAAKRGLWSGEFQRPREWRRSRGEQRE